MLTAGAGGSVNLHFDVLGVDLYVHFFHLRQNRHGGGGGVDTAAGFGFRHPLHPVNTGFILHPAVGATAVNDKICLLDAAKLGFAII